MIYGNLIIIAVPALLAAIGAFCAAKEQKALFSLVFGAAVFLEAGLCRIMDPVPSGFEEQLAGSVYSDIISGTEAPPAYLFILKICMTAGIGTGGFMTVQAVLQSFLAAAYIYNRPDAPYAGAVIFSAFFLPCSFVGANAFTAILISLFSAKYIEERRFLRAAAVLIAAACFDVSAVFVIPLWFITIIPNNFAVLLISAALAAASAMLPDVTAGVFGYFGTGMFTGRYVTVPMAAAACIAALVLMITASMFRKRNERTARLIPFTICGAALSAAGIFVPELFVVSRIMLAVSLTALAPDAEWISGRFTEILLPGAGTKARVASVILLTAVVTTVCIILTADDSMGTSYFGTVLFGAGA